MRVSPLKKFYTCPMHPEIKKENPGICPICGMKLVPQESKIGEKKEMAGGKHVGHSIAIFAKKFWVCLFLTIPILVYSDFLEKIFGWRAPIFPGSQYLPLIFGSIIFFYGGWIFIIGALRELKTKLPGMMTLIAIAISAAYFYSIFAVIVGKGQALLWELATLITIMLLGHWMEMRAVQGTQRALKELSKLLPDTAEIIDDSGSKIIALSELKVGDLVFVRPGGKIPADGVVIEGESDVDEAMVTGESKPVKKIEKNEVIAGTINGNGSLKVRVAKIGENTFLAGVMRLVAEAQASKSRLQILSDKAAFYLTLIAVFGGSLTFVLWILSDRTFGFAVERMVAVLVIACPHALGLAVPLVASISTAMAARSGFLVRQRLALESARNVDIILFDKTGTLTKGVYGVEKLIQNAKVGINKNEILQFAASVDSQSEHFISKAIVAKAKEEKIDLLEVKNFKRLAGKGVRGIVGGKEVLVGGEAILGETNIKAIPEELKSEKDNFAKQGKTIIYVIISGELAGIIALADLIREESREAIGYLKNMGIKVGMITGDSEDVARWVAGELGIDEYFAKILPQEKSEIVKKIQQREIGNWKLEIKNSRQQRVAMVGDGINDAPALVQADIGIAIGAGTNVAIESAGIILVRNDPRDIVKIIKLSRLTYNKMMQNLFWATGYNIVALPLAAGVLAFRGILLEPALAALFMSLSTVIVAINAIFLRWRKF